VIIPFIKADPEKEVKDMDFIHMSVADGSVQALCES
jgi:hypothetical protein